MLMKRLAVKS